MSARHTLRLFLLRSCGLLLRRLMSSAVAAPAGSVRVLLLRPDHLGDVLLSRPAIDALAGALPDAEVAVAVGPWGRPALGPAGGTEILICPFPGFSRSPIGYLHPYLLLLRYAVRWRRTGHFAIAVVLRPDHWWGALLACLAGIPVRVGYGTPESAPFLTVALPPAPGRHAARAAIDLVKAAAVAAGGRVADDQQSCSVLPRVATPMDERAVAALLQEAGIAPDRPLLVLHPGAGAPLKSWPLPDFAVIGSRLGLRLGAQVIVTGSAAERDLAQRLCDLLPGALNLAGRLSWAELEGLLGRAALVIGVDSGPLHLAVAAGTPSVALFGPADPVQFAPWGSPARHRTVAADLPCRPCRRLDYCRIEPGQDGPPPCMRAITAGVVEDAALAALHEGRYSAAAAD